MTPFLPTRSVPTTPLLSPEGRLALERLLRSEPLLAFDFDGTLAPLVDRPEEARMPKDSAHLLRQLGRLCPIAIVTGRSVADVSPRLGFEPRFIIGNHGAEGDSVSLDPGELAALERLRQDLAARSDSFVANGITVEDKRLSMTLHYRLAPDPVRAKAMIDTALAGHEAGLNAQAGKLCVNIVPAHAPDKGQALLALAERIGRRNVLFAGDDVTDESVFRQAPENWITLRIGTENPDTAARFHLETQAEMGMLLLTMKKLSLK